LIRETRRRFKYCGAFTIVSDAKIYSDMLEGKKENTALTAITMVEDAVLNAYLKTFHLDLLPQIMVGDALSYLMLKPAYLIRNRGLRIATSILSLYKTGMVKGSLGDELKNIKRIVGRLRNLEKRSIKAFSKLKNRLDAVKVEDNEFKRKVFSEIYESLSRYAATLPEVPSFLYMNHLSRNSIFMADSNPPAERDIQGTISEMKRRLGLQVNINYEALRSEASQNLWDSSKISLFQSMTTPSS